MALFQRRPDTGSHLPLYSIGLTKNLVIVGLGNVGKKYDGTRHNIGFAAVDKLAEALGFEDWSEKKDLKCLVTQATVGSNRVILCKPSTMMNLSGEAVQKLLHFYKVPLEHMAVVHDELDIPYGQIRIRKGGGSAGHNGVKSISQQIGEDYNRIRIGIQNKSRLETTDYVLGKFNAEEKTHLDALLKESTAILSEFTHNGELPAETRQFIFA